MTQRFVETKRIFLRFFALFLLSIGALVSLYQYHDRGQLAFSFTIGFSLVLAFLGATLATVFLVMVNRMDRQFHQYQPPHESETTGIREFVFAGERLRFDSPHPPDMAIAKLRENIVEAPILWLDYSVDAVVGRVRVNKVKLAWSRSGMRNSFNPIFVGTFSHCGAGSTLEGVYRLPFLVTAILCVWFGGLIAITIMAVVVVSKASGWAILTWPAARVTGLFVLAGLVMGAGGVGLVAFGRRISRASLAQMSEVIRKSIA